MKKIRKMICIVAIALMVCFVCTACETTYQEAVLEGHVTENNMCGNYFTTVTEWYDDPIHYKIVYAKDTKVKYFIAISNHKFGITPLYNADGTLQVYEE